MNKKNLAGAIIASLSLPLMLVTFSAPLANAASVSSSVTTVDNCKWVMANVPGEIAMSTSATYNGDALSVSAVIAAPTLGLSGTTSTVVAQAASTECSFYNTVVDAEVTAAISSVSFVAYYGNAADNSGNTPDTAMDFALGAGSGFAQMNMTFSVDSCATINTGWSGSSAVFTAASSVTLFAFAGVTTDVYETAAAPICYPETSVELIIPDRSSVPAGAGQRYSWDGPVITFASNPNTYNN